MLLRHNQAKKREETMAKKKSTNGKEKESVEIVNVPIEWHMPEGVMTPFASNMIVQSLEHEFKLSFFETKPPIRSAGSGNPTPSGVRADCIASVIVSAEKLPEFINALQSQLDKYRAKKEKIGLISIDFTR